MKNALGIANRIKQSFRRLLSRQGYTLVRTAGLPLLVKQQGYTVYQTDDPPIHRDLCCDMKRLAARVPFEIETVLDVGANVGQTSRRFARAFPRATIYAFEPIAQTFETLLKNTQHNERIQPHHFAMGAAAGTATIHLKPYTEMNSLVAELNQPTRGIGVSEEIKISTVDAFAASETLPRIDLLKTDTEGFDLQVLQGAERLLNDGKVVFVLSEVGFWQAHKGNTSFCDLSSYLYAKDFVFYGLYDSAHHSAGLTWANALFVNKKIVPFISEQEPDV